MPRAGDTCYTCGAPAVSDDHIPARCLFPTPRPHALQLITVPSCDAHNHERGGDDDYFRRIVTVGAADNPSAMAWIDKKVLRSLGRDKKELQKFLAGAHDRIPIVSEGGIIMGFRPGFDVDRPRMQRVYSAEWGSSPASSRA